MLLPKVNQIALLQGSTLVYPHFLEGKEEVSHAMQHTQHPSRTVNFVAGVRRGASYSPDHPITVNPGFIDLVAYYRPKNVNKGRFKQSAFPPE